MVSVEDGALHFRDGRWRMEQGTSEAVGGDVSIAVLQNLQVEHGAAVGWSKLPAEAGGSRWLLEGGGRGYR